MILCICFQGSLNSGVLARRCSKLVKINFFKERMAWIENEFLLYSQKRTTPVGSTYVSNVTTHVVVFSQPQTSQHHHQHQRQTSNNDNRHRVFLHKNDGRPNVRMFGVMMSYFCFVHINYGATFHYEIAF